MVKNSIEKLNEQIDMLQNKKFVEKVKTKTIRVAKKNRKVILEEATIAQDTLMADLIGTNEKTKIYASNELGASNTKFMDTITIGNMTINQEKIMDIYLPIFLGLLIFVFIIFIIMI